MAFKKPIEPIFSQRILLRIGALALSIILWIFVVSENEYTMIMDLPIEARNLSEQKAHKEEVPQIASVRLRGTGRNLFKSYILKNYSGFKLVLDLEGISNEYEFILNEYFQKYPQKVVLPPNFNVSFIEVVYPNRIMINLDEYKVKNVPVISNLEILPAPGHIQVGEIQLKPPMIEIAGPKEELAIINHVQTLYDTIIGISNQFSGNIDLLLHGRHINYSKENIDIKIDVQEIGERIIVDIPVKVINKRDMVRVFPSPQTVSLTVVGGINRISKLSPKDIEVIIDFNDWNSKIQFYEPIINLPEHIIESRNLSPRTLELGVARQIK